MLEKIETVVVDKDLSELAAIKISIPQANIRLCFFHILGAYTKHLTKLTLNDEQKEQAITLFRQLCYATSLEEYNEIESRMFEICPSSLVAYFRSNWQNIKEMWAGYTLGNITSYGNTTNNRLESKNSKLKLVMNRTDGVIASLNKLVKFMGSDLLQRNYLKFREIYTSSKKRQDSEIVTLAKSILTDFAVSIIKKNENFQTFKV